MSVWKCNACGSVYSDTCADGLAYYHACAWVPDPVAPIPIVPTVDLRPLVRRAGHRDENLVVGAEPVPMGNLSTLPVGVLSQGAGRTPVP